MHGHDKIQDVELVFETKGIFMGFQNKKYPGAFSPKVDSIIRRIVRSPCLHLFSGTSDIGDVRVDLERPEATNNEDVFEFIKKDNRIWKFVVADPPYEINSPQRHKIDRMYASFTPMNSTRQNQISTWLKNHAENVLWLDLTAPRPKGFYRYKTWLLFPGGWHHVRVLSYLKREGEFLG
jgi:hypothetical protein